MAGRVHHDKNHRSITLALQAAGCIVYNTAALGRGFPDVVAVAPDGRVFLIEIKADDGGALQPAQVQFLLHSVVEPVRIFTSPTQAARVVRGGK